MKLIRYDNRFYFCIEGKILNMPLPIILIPANGRDIDQIEKAIKCLRQGLPIED